MLNLHRALQSDRLLRALTGLNWKAVEELELTFVQVLANAEEPHRSPWPRQRASGAGRKPTLATVEAKWFFIWFSFKVYPTFDLASLVFDLDRDQANRWMHRLQLRLEEALGETLALPKRNVTRLEDFITAFPDVKRVILDRTERPIQRAKDRDKQQADDSGKKTQAMAMGFMTRPVSMAELLNYRGFEALLLEQTSAFKCSRLISKKHAYH